MVACAFLKFESPTQMSREPYLGKAKALTAA